MTERVELVDYPAVAPPNTQKKLNSFLDACRQVRETHRDEQRRARLTLASSQATALRDRRDELVPLLDQGDRWLVQHPDDEDEQHWFHAESEYRAIVDVLELGLRLAFGASPTVEQSSMVLREVAP